MTGGAALSALTMSVNEPLFELLITLALIAGTVTSALGIRRGRLFILPGAALMLLSLTMFVFRFIPSPAISLFYPPEVLGHEDQVLAAMVCWLLVAFSFWQSSRANLIFLIVSGLAIFGLMGTVNLNLEMRLAFAVFVLGAVFCWSYEQFLDVDDRLEASGQGRIPNWLEMARGHVSIAVLVGLLTFGVGSAVGTGVYSVSPNVYARMAREVYGWSPARNDNRGFNSFRSEFDVATGPVRLMPVPVMRVRADHAALWRGRVYDYYNGRGWSRQTEHIKPMSFDGMQFRAPREFVQPVKYWQEHVQRVTLEGVGGPLLASAQPDALLIKRTEQLNPYWGDGGGRAEPGMDSYGCVTSAGRHVREYEVTSREPLVEPTLLQRAPAEYSQKIRTQYLEVPAGTQAALGATVNSIVGGLTNPYDRVAALQQFLQEEMAYSLAAPALPKGEDAAAWFVLKSKRGACDIFATSLAVMARMSGVPARVATGYQSGRYDPHDGVFIVKGTDAHAWAEIYFPGHGWVPFDPQAETQLDELSLTEMLGRGQWHWAARVLGKRLGTAAIVLLLVLIAAAAVVDPLRFVRRGLGARHASPLQRLSREYRDLYQALLRRNGFSPSPALTPQEAMQENLQALARRGVDSELLHGLNERFYNLRYAPEAPEREIEAMRLEIRRLRRRLRRL